MKAIILITDSEAMREFERVTRMWSFDVAEVA